MMKNFRSLLCFTLLGMAISVSGCGEEAGSDGVAGIDGTGGIVNAVSNGAIMSSGSITHIGENSITVNGRDFDTRGSFVIIDGKPGLDSDITALAEGQVVTIKGAVDENVATARDIIVNTQLRGAIENIDTRSQTLTVLGQTIAISGETIFTGTVNQFDELRAGDVIEVSGFRLTRGNLSASRVHRITQVDALYVISGKIEGLDSENSQFTINGLTVDYELLKREVLSDGLLVQVQGPPLNPRNQLEASVIRKTPSDFLGVNVSLELEGIITDTGNWPRQFSIGDVVVDITPETLWVGGDISQIQQDTKLEVEGDLWWVDGILTAEVIIF